MEDIARLAIQIKTGDILRAQAELQRLEAAGRKAERQSKNLTKSFKLNAISAKALTSSLFSMKTAMIGIGVVMSAQRLIKRADEMTMLSSKLSLVTKSSQELLEVQEKLFVISQDARVSFSETADLYARMARSTKNTTITQKEVLEVTEAISKSLIISGASAESANAALVQLGQGFAADALRGQELNSVLEQTPRLAQAIAEGMGVGLGKLREIAAEGKLTTKVTMDAIRSQAKAIDDEFSRMAMTVDQSTTMVNNSFLVMIGNIDNATGATRDLAEMFSGFSKDLDSNSQDIVAWSRFIYATVDRTIDIFNVLWEIVENGAQSLIYSLNIAVYGFGAGVTKMALGVSESLNAIGLLSDKELEQNRKLSTWLDNEYKKAQQGIIDGGKEIQEALEKANITVEERISLMVQEEKTAKKVKEAIKSANDAKDKANKLTKEQIKLAIQLSKIQEDSRRRGLKSWYDDEEEENKKAIKQADDFAESFVKGFSNTRTTQEFDAWLSERNDYWTKELSGDDAKKSTVNFSQLFAESLQDGIQDAFEGNFDFSKIVSSLSSSMGSSLMSASMTAMMPQMSAMAGPWGLAAGVGLMGLGSLFGGGSKGISVEQQAQNDFDTFIESVNKASDALKDIGNIGTATDEAFNAINARIKEYEYKQSYVYNNSIYGSGGMSILRREDEMGITRGAVDIVVDKLYAEKAKMEMDILSENLDFTKMSLSTIQDLTSGIDLDKAENYTKQLNEIALAYKESGKTYKEFSTTLFDGVEGAENYADAIATLISDEDYKNALNYSDALDIVSDSLKTSTDNIKAWEDGFKTQQELASDMATSLGVSVANSFDGLDSLFKNFKNDIDGLIDIEYDFLKANKALLDNTKSMLSSAYLGEYSPFSLYQKQDYANQMAYNPSSLGGADAAYLALQASAATATRDEDIALDFNRYEDVLENQAPDATQQDIVNSILETNKKLDELTNKVEMVYQSA